MFVALNIHDTTIYSVISREKKNDAHLIYKFIKLYPSFYTKTDFTLKLRQGV